MAKPVDDGTLLMAKPLDHVAGDKARAGELVSASTPSAASRPMLITRGAAASMSVLPHLKQTEQKLHGHLQAYVAQLKQEHGRAHQTLQNTLEQRQAAICQQLEDRHSTLEDRVSQLRGRLEALDHTVVATHAQSESEVALIRRRVDTVLANNKEQTERRFFKASEGQTVCKELQRCVESLDRHSKRLSALEAEHYRHVEETKGAFDVHEQTLMYSSMTDGLRQGSASPLQAAQSPEQLASEERLAAVEEALRRLATEAQLRNHMDGLRDKVQDHSSNLAKEEHRLRLHRAQLPASPCWQAQGAMPCEGGGGAGQLHGDTKARDDLPAFNNPEALTFGASTEHVLTANPAFTLLRHRVENLEQAVRDVDHRFDSRFDELQQHPQPSLDDCIDAFHPIRSDAYFTPSDRTPVSLQQHPQPNLDDCFDAFDPIRSEGVCSSPAESA